MQVPYTNLLLALNLKLYREIIGNVFPTHDGFTLVACYLKNILLEMIQPEVLWKIAAEDRDR